MAGEKLSASVLLTIAVTLLTMGVTFIQQGNYETGVVCLLVGFGLIVATIYLLERGIISRVMKK